MSHWTRRPSIVVNVAGVEIGGENPIVVQSMTNTDTSDVKATVAQAKALAEAGSELVRVTVNDEAAAQAAGHPGVILHGLCTMAMAGAALIERACGGDPARLARLKVRFTRIVLPGDTLEVRAWSQGESEGNTVLGFETVNQRGETVIGNALAEIRPTTG